MSNFLFGDPDSLQETIKNRLKSPMYGTFILSWCFWNWEFIYSTLFLSEKYIMESTRNLKIDYILALYPSNNLSELFCPTFIKLLFMPVIMTYFIIWWLSKIEVIVHKKSQILKIEKESETLDQELHIIDKRNRNKIKEAQERLIEKAETEQDIKAIKEALSQEEKWDIEYDISSKTKRFFPALQELKECIYSRDGYLEYESFTMDNNIKAFLHSNMLFDYFEGGVNKIYLTGKGKYFLKRYMENHF